MDSQKNFLENIKSVLPVISVLFLTYGYAYLNIYYSNFGIKVQNFFSIEDYLRANIDNIYKLVFPFLLSFLWGFFSKMIDSKQVTQRRKIFEDIITYILLATLIIAGIVSTYIVKSPARYWLYWLAAMGIWVEVVSKVTSKIRDKFEKFNIWGYLSVFILLPLTFINLYFNAKLDAANIIELKKPSNIEVSFDDNFLKLNKIDTKHLFLIGSNSNYMFFYDANSSLTYIAPLNMVKGITVKMNIS